MPVLEPVVASGDKLSLRLIGPRAKVWPTTPAANLSLLARSDLVARPVPCSQLPDSPDLVTGSYTLRLDDAGEGEFTYPNKEASDGVPYRQRFDPTGHLMFLEVYLDGVIEQVLCLDTVNPTDGRGFASTLDATDFCAEMWGNGAGLQNGSNGQLQAVVFDPVTLANSLFAAQGWQDFSDAAFPSLLQALLNSQLGLRLEPWQLLTADPTGAGGGGQIGLHGQDAWFLLKKAYERDWTVVQSPRDVIERGTQVWLNTLVDDFPAGSLNAQWTPSAQGVQMNAGGGVTLTANGSLLIDGNISSQTITLPAATGTWRAVCEFTIIGSISGYGSAAGVYLQVTQSDGIAWSAGTIGATGTLYEVHTPIATAAIPSSTTYQLMLESDGEWISSYVNGQLIGTSRRGSGSTTSLQITIGAQAAGVGSTISAVLDSAFVEALQPLLQRGTDKGDYVLPGTASTYPSGGLHARYFNNLDLQSDANAPAKIHAPLRTQAFGGSSPSEYANQQDATINGQPNPTPGAATTWWSAIWCGAIWLPLSKGDFTFAFTLPSGGSARVWIGKTQFGQQLLDQWPGTPATYTFTVTAASLAGTLPYGAGTKNRDGWYPIKVEYGVDNIAATAPALNFYTTPAAYTDPGGTLCPQRTATPGLVPATSLSPLGCVDQRYQGVSHFDLVQQTVQAFGYQASVEPYRLETLELSNQVGYFPGQLAPRIREGHDTDLKLTPDKGARQDWTGTLKPQLANNWPLTGAIAAMRWRPGDGIFVRNEAIGVWDTSPRQILTFVRNLLPNGIASAVASLANRPRNAARALKQQLYTVSRLQRNYQRQLTTLSGTRQLATLAAGATDTGSSVIVLATNETIIGAQLRVTNNSGGVSFNVLVNGVDITAQLNGPWTTLPLNLPLRAFAALGSDNRLYVQLKNNSGTTSSTFDYQLFLDVLR